MKKLKLFIPFLTLLLFQSCFDVEDKITPKETITQRIFITDSLYDHYSNKMVLYKSTFFEWGELGKSSFFYFDKETNGIKNLPLTNGDADYVHSLSINEIMPVYTPILEDISGIHRRYKMKSNYNMQEWWEIDFDIKKLNEQKNIKIVYTIENLVYTLYCHYEDIEYEKI